MKARFWAGSLLNMKSAKIVDVGNRLPCSTLFIVTLWQFWKDRIDKVSII